MDSCMSGPVVANMVEGMIPSPTISLGGSSVSLCRWSSPSTHDISLCADANGSVFTYRWPAMDDY